MAGIDKTWTSSYSDYKEFRDWAKTQTITFFNGHRVKISDWVFEYESSDFTGSELPIMNSPTWLDTYLIQNCPSKFVIDRLKSVYSEESYKELESIDLSKRPPIEFEQKRKIKVKRGSNTMYPIHNKPYDSKTKWWLQCNGDLYYNDETKTWAMSDYYPTSTNTAVFRSVRGAVKQLRKQYLPKGITFKLIGGYIGEEYLIEVK